MKLTRKCGILILHKALKDRRSGNTHNYWVAFNGTDFNLNWCNGRRQGTLRAFGNLRAAAHYFNNHIED